VTFFLDHDVPRHIADLLWRHGHKVELVADVMAPDSSDEKVFAYSVKANAIMVSCNRNDFLEVASTLAHPGLIILIRSRSALSEAGHLLELLRKAGQAGLAGNINFA